MTRHRIRPARRVPIMLGSALLLSLLSLAGHPAGAAHLSAVRRAWRLARSDQ